MRVKIKMKYLVTLLIAVFTSIGVFFVLDYFTEPDLGAITTLLATDLLKDSRTDINDTFTDLDTTKMEMSTTSVASITTLGGLTSATALASIGTLTSGATGSGFTVDLDASTFTCSTCILSGDYAAASIDGDDINSNIAGRSLTLTSASPDTLDADVELYTFVISANLFATTTVDGIATTSENFISVQIPTASTITRFTCYADDAGTATIRASISTDGISAGSDILYSTGTDCTSGSETATSTFSATAIGARDWIHFYVSDAEPTGSRPRVIYVSLEATKND